MMMNNAWLSTKALGKVACHHEVECFTHFEGNRATLLLVEYSENVMCVECRISKWEKLTIHIFENGLSDEATGAGLKRSD